MKIRPALLLLFALCLAAVLRIAATYHVFNSTTDEPLHIAVGLQYLHTGRYDYETLHPPMRAVYAIGPYLLGVPSFGEQDLIDESRRVMYDGGNYWKTLTAARVAALPFFVGTIALVFVWARRIAGARAGVLAALMYSTLPLALGLAGLAVTDTLIAATLPLALFAWAHWLTRPTPRHALLFGVAVAAAVLSKLTTLLFLPPILLITGVLWLLRSRPLDATAIPPRARARLRVAVVGAALTILGAILSLWAAFHFSLEPMLARDQPHPHFEEVVSRHGPLVHGVATFLAEMPIPARDLLLGIHESMQRNADLTPSYFMGDISRTGHLAFFPVGILIKTPIPFLVLMFLGGAIMLRQALRQRDVFALLPPLAVIVIVVVCVPARLNIGIRHVLPAFPLLAICAGVAASDLWQTAADSTGWRRAAVGAAVALLLGWQVVAGVRAHPDYLAYFNECCERAPERWLVDSDLDWGQDLQRLADELQRRNVRELHLSYKGTADLKLHGLPPFQMLEPYQRVSGWIAISEYKLAFGERTEPFQGFAWLREYEPVTRVGKSIRLYYIPDKP